MRAVVLTLTLLLAACDSGPSCEERGGKTAMSHMLPVWAGKSLVLVPQYKCEMPE